MLPTAHTHYNTPFASLLSCYIPLAIYIHFVTRQAINGYSSLIPIFSVPGSPLPFPRATYHRAPPITLCLCL